MSSEDVPAPDPEKVSATFRQLEAAATQLNAVSDQLGESITALDLILKRLNLGIPAWEKIAGDYDANTGSFWAHEIGYAKIDGKWGIALRTRDGDAADPEDEHIERWLFSDAPRKLRLDAIDKLPELLDRLIKEAESIAEKIKDKIGRAQQVVTAVKSAETREIDKAQTSRFTAAKQAAALRSAPQQRK